MTDILQKAGFSVGKKSLKTKDFLWSHDYLRKEKKP